MKLSKKQIDIIRRLTPEELKGKQEMIIISFGYFMPNGCNWSYQVGYVKYKENYQLVVTRFGEII